MRQTFVKTPFENIMNFLNVIPQGHEKALKQAFYNAVALFVLMICAAAGWALFYIFEPFVKPLVWALLVGSVLHPFKHSLTKYFEIWFHQINSSRAPLCFKFFMVPFSLLDYISEIIGEIMMTYIKLLASFAIGILAVFLIYSYTPTFCFNLIPVIWSINSNTMHFIMNMLSLNILVLLFAVYIGILIFYWNEENKHLLSVASYIFWLLISLYVAKIFGFLQIPLFLFLLFTLSCGFAFEVFTVFTLSCEKISLWKAVKHVFDGSASFSNEDVKNIEEENASFDDFDGDQEGISKKDVQRDESSEQAKEKTNSSSSGSKKSNLVKSSSDYFNKSDYYMSLGQTLRLSHFEFKTADNEMNGKESSKYIFGVFWACALMMVWKNFWIIHFLPIPIAVYFIKHLGHYFGVYDLLYSQWLALKESIIPWIKMRELALFPPPIQGVYKFAAKLRTKLMNKIHDSINSFASSFVILGLILFVFSFSLFLIFQIYAEGIHLVTVFTNVVNRTLVNNPDFLKLLPEGWGDKMESVINDAYIYGREGISKQVKQLLKDVDDVKASEIEKQILELWDRVYQAWLVGSLENNSNVGPKVNSKAVFSSWENFLGIFYKMPHLFNVTVVMEFAKENVGSIFSLLESVWNLLKGNLNLIFQFFFATLSVILGGGTVVLNFFISSIVFFTALFYLLSSSGAVYKPVELLSNFSPNNGGKWGEAFETAISGVFKASFKMALFYGLWTWLVHNLFQVRIVYLPSVLAAILGAVPFLGTYWASVPAVLDLWLAQQKGVQAIILFVFHCLPMSFVDTAIYREIKEGHPYMSGLAIAGGVFCMGIQGAIFGPILLCCLLVALNMSSSLMKESPNDPTLTSLSMRQLRREDKMIDKGKEKGKPEESDC